MSHDTSLHGDASAETFDVVVIGAGPVGENVADRVVQGGLTAVVIERELVGGECSYWACMPTKALLRDAAALRAVRALPGGRAVASGTLDPRLVLERRDRFASDWSDAGQVQWLEGAGITLLRGHGRIVGPRAVAVTGDDGVDRVVHARRGVVVATGSRALLPPIPGLADAAPWTSREAAAAAHPPQRLAIIGGGVVGSEMATAFNALGTQVTLISQTRLLPTAEPFASDLVATTLEKAGVVLHLDSTAVDVQRRPSGEVRVRLADGSDVIADDLLIAAGRVPNTQDLGLESIGLRSGAWLDVDATLAVLDESGKPLDGDWLFAAGDVNRRALLTHHGKYQARALGDALVTRARGARPDHGPWGRHAVTADEHALAQVVFTDPEVASVGLTAEAAIDAGLEIQAVDYDLGAVAGAALHADDYQGRARMVVDTRRGVLVGFTAVGPDVAELLHAATIAISAEVPLDRLWHAVPAYPTVSEVWLRLLETLGREA